MTPPRLLALAVTFATGIAATQAAPAPIQKPGHLTGTPNVAVGGVTYTGAG